MGQITPQPGIMDIALYQGGESKIEGANRVTKLSSNENPHGASPLAKAAFVEAAEDLALYPTTDHRSLREAIARVNGLDAERIICGAGSDEIIAFLCNAYAGNVVMTRTFSKIYGLGGLRVGYGYAPTHVIETLNRIRGPFNLSGAGLAAAEAAILDLCWRGSRMRSRPSGRISGCERAA